MPLIELLDDLLGQRAKVRVLRVLMGEKDALVGRDIARRSGLSPLAAHMALHALEKRGVLTKKCVGSGHLYSVNRRRFVVSQMLEVLFAREKEFLGAMGDWVARKVGSKPLVSLAIYGSVARGQSSPDSDLDVLILAKDPVQADAMKEKIEAAALEFHDLFGMNLSAYAIDTKDFSRRFDKKDRLIKAMVREGWVIRGKSLAEVLADEPQKGV